MSLPVCLRFHDLKERGFVKSWPALRNLILHSGFPPGRLTGPQIRVWTEQEVLEWFNTRPTETKVSRARRKRMSQVGKARVAEKGSPSGWSCFPSRNSLTWRMHCSRRGRCYEQRRQRGALSGDDGRGDPCSTEASDTVSAPSKGRQDEGALSPKSPQHQQRGEGCRRCTGLACEPANRAM